MHGIIETIAFGGQGILRDNGYVVFIPFTAPGDEIQFELIHKKKKHGEGKLLHLVNPSPLRTDPLCPYYGTCGGCQFQHLSYAAQLEIKRKFIEDALNRLALASISIAPIIPSENIWSYRKHIRLNIRPFEHNLSAGYIGYDHHDFIPVEKCPIFIDSNDTLLADVQKFLSRLRDHLIHVKEEQTASIRIFKRQNHYLLIFSFSDHLPKNSLELAHGALRNHPSWGGVMISSPDQTISAGNIECTLEVLGLKLQFSPFGFIQNHAEQSEKLYRYILDQIPADATRALDLYCGIGVTSLLMGKKGMETIGIESHAETVKMAEQNAIDNGVNNVAYHCGKAEVLIGRFLKQAHYDVVLLNPPRTGLDPRVITELLAAAPQRLIYVSCMPPTLARDLRLFLQSGYQIEKVQGFDMFPQTTHVETVVVLKKAL